MKQILFFILFVLIQLTCEKIEIQRIVKVETLPVSSYTSTTATLPGNIIDPGDGIKERGHYYWHAGNETNPLKASSESETSGYYTSEIVGLLPVTTYYVKAFASDVNGEVLGQVMQFTTECQLEPDFTASQTTIYVNQSVQFTDLSNCMPTAWYWEFGDDDTSRSQNPLHTYSTVGTFTVLLLVTSDDGLETKEKLNYIKVNEIPTNAFIDMRDGHLYRWVQIGNQFWMSENLAYLPEVSPPTDGYNAKPYYYVYNYSGRIATEAKATTSYSTYGVLYNWFAAMAGSVSSNNNPSGVQGICPDGWHLPSDAEWQQLVGFVSSDGHSGTEGTALKAASGWNSGGNGTDNYSFSALPGGGRGSDGTFYGVGNWGWWWTATAQNSTTASRRGFSFDYDKSSLDQVNRERGYRVRCVKD